MENHTEILNKVAERIKAFEQGGGDMEEDLWPPAREVLAEIKSILQEANPPVIHQSDS
ncbi:uncharacterized protein METZ01_LOCUS366256, partial [marine metagenome]